ncbi:MAG: GAF domain-containing protein [Actinomycetota bacterium]|nr:GAF domain-containing protein [Actinomycetota bacterium]
MNDDRFRAAVAAGVLASEDAHRALLRAIVQVARAIFHAQASSIMLLDEETDELVFEAVAREEEQHLVGMRFPSSAGIAGWVLVTRQPLVLEDVRSDPRHAGDVAKRTGYVPQGLMAVPLLHEERALGVLQVLDRQTAFSLEEMDLLGMFGNQAAIALDLLKRARRARAALQGAGGDVVAVARVAAAVEALEDARREAGLRLLAALEDVLRQ